MSGPRLFAAALALSGAVLAAAGVVFRARRRLPVRLPAGRVREPERLARWVGSCLVAGGFVLIGFATLSVFVEQATATLLFSIPVLMAVAAAALFGSLRFLE